jgi:hypothetical protein
VTEELEVLTIVAGRLEAAGIAYMVTGSFAANYYAVPRMTRDIDLVVELSAGDADRFCDTDVRNLLRSMPDLDKYYLERWSERLGLAALYREALGD